MAQLRQDYDKFVERQTAVIVVGPEDAKAFARFWRENHLPFVGLPDPEHRVLKLYGQEIKLFKYGRMPAQVLVDRAGVARFVHYGHEMSDIPRTEEILGLIDALSAEQAGGPPGEGGAEEPGGGQLEEPRGGKGQEPGGGRPTE
jgi:peroxiredoxin Q/BCP